MLQEEEVKELRIEGELRIIFVSKCKGILHLKQSALQHGLDESIKEDWWDASQRGAMNSASGGTQDESLV